MARIGFAPMPNSPGCGGVDWTRSESGHGSEVHPATDTQAALAGIEPGPQHYTPGRPLLAPEAVIAALTAHHARPATIPANSFSAVALASPALISPARDP